MGTDEQDDSTTYDVVVNEEEQYSIWPTHKDPPHGWYRIGTRGRKSDCLAYIEDVWTNMP
jgi:MbtH protein